MCVRFWLPCDPLPPGDKSHLNWPSSSNAGTDEENRGYEGTVIFNGNTFCGIAVPILIKGSREAIVEVFGVSFEQNTRIIHRSIVETPSDGISCS